MEDIALELKNIDYSYGEKRVLNNISFFSFYGLKTSLDGVFLILLNPYV